MIARRVNRYYLVKESILPDAIINTARVKEMLTRGEALTVNEAVERIGMSRSAFYKYRDGVMPYDRDDKEKVAAITLILEHRAGVLSNVLNAVAEMKGNIDSINQSMPVHGVAVATMNVNVTLVGDVSALAESLRRQEGVKRVEIIAQP